LRRSTIHPRDERGYRAFLRDRACVEPDRLISHEVRPHFDVKDDVLERRANGPMPDVKFTIELLIGQVSAQQKQLVCRPGVVSK
jgi:hypothetical protein